MPDKFADFNEERESEDPKDLVVRAFSRCQNYPKELAGISGLAQGLAYASKCYGVPAQDIIQHYVETSPFCPTDNDFLRVAESLKPAPKRIGPRICPYGHCDGSGWVASWWLHTHHRNPNWVEKERITFEQYQNLSRTVDWQTQMAYEGRGRCSCHPARPDEIEKRGKYA